MPDTELASALAKLERGAKADPDALWLANFEPAEAAALLADRARMVEAIQLAQKWADAPGACFLKLRNVRGALAQTGVLADGTAKDQP